MASLGEIAYEAYTKAMGFTSEWENLTDRVRSAWEAAAQAVDDSIGAGYR